MGMPPSNRTVRPDAEAIKRLRLEKGWRVEDLAKNAKCSVKTVENVERGANVYRFTLAKFAKELGVEYVALVAGGKPPPMPPRPNPNVQVQIVLSIPFDQFDESEQLGGFIEFLKQFMQGGGNINVVGVTPGSTIITLEMSFEDMVALFAAYSKGKLAEMHCEEFRLKLEPETSAPDHIIKAPFIDKKLKEITQFTFEPPKRKRKKPKPDTGR
jgi:transcriptional regulator with XRE-family HTH domain